MKDTSSEYKYRITDLMQNAEYYKVEWRIRNNDKGAGRKSSSRFFDNYIERGEQGDSFEYGRQSVGRSPTGYGRESRDTLPMAGDETGREGTEDNTRRNNAHSSGNIKRRFIGLTNGNDSVVIKYSVDSPSRDYYSTQKIIEAKALASDDSELIEAAKENTKQVRSFVRMNSDKQ